MPDPIYLDHAATTPVRKEVREAMDPFYGPRFGNPSSAHRWGREARAALDEARERVARCIGATPGELLFTSGGTEADNLAILGAFRALSPKGKRAAVTTPIEHKAVLASVHHVAQEGGIERILTVDRNGVVERASFDDAVRDDVAVVSVMWVNNELGTIQDVPALAAAAKAKGALFHTDGVQAFGKVKVDARTQSFDYFAFSGHKIGAPKGIGAQFIRRGSPLEPLQHGGQQNRGQRPGTENVAAAVGLARAAELTLAEMDEELARLTAMRDTLQAALLANIPDAVVHAQHAPRAAHILSISVPGTDSESLLMAMDLAGVACSSGSACQSGNVDPSHVLCAIGSPRDVAVAAIRMSLGSLTTPEQIDRVAQIFPKLVAKARRLAAAAS
jgi:cysteine desulfurase